MEHRWSFRKPIQRRVGVEFLQTGPLVVNLRDISLGGAFVESGLVILPINAVGTISFSIPRGETLEHFRVGATVIHRTVNGAGLMFLDMDNDVMRALRGVLNTPPPGPNTDEWPRANIA